MGREQYLEEAKAVGFDHVGWADPAKLQAIDEVRDMCNANKCQAFNTRWTCPPACGTIEECNAKMLGYTDGVLVQTTAELEDEFDFEGMMDSERRHKANFTKLCDRYHEQNLEFLPLGSGACTICKECTYPDNPCRFPNRAVSSMEANGLLVSQVCQDNDLPYYYGRNTVTYTSLILLK